MASVISQHLPHDNIKAHSFYLVRLLHPSIIEKMRFSDIIFAATAVLTSVQFVSAANSFAGSNLYYAAGLSASTRKTLLE